MIVDRREMRERIAGILDLLMHYRDSPPPAGVVRRKNLTVAASGD
jgi:hypothetical protein